MAISEAMLTEGVLAEEVSALCEAAWARHHLLPKGLDRVWLESVEEMHQLKNSRDLQGCASKFARNHGGLAFLPPFSCTHARPSGWLRLPALAAPVAVAPQALSPAPVRQGGGAASTTRVITYTYDPLYRLTLAVYSGTLTNTYVYAYDARRPFRSHSNRTAMTDTAGAHSYTYDIANRLVLSAVEGLTSVDSVTYTWDDNGNLRNNGVFTFTYDSANRLITVTNGTTLTLGYRYNGDEAGQNEPLIQLLLLGR